MNKFKKAKTTPKENMKKAVKEQWGIRNMPSVDLRLGDMAYTPIGVSKVEWYDLRKEYSRLRHIVIERARRLSAKGYVNDVTRFVEKGIPTLTDIGGDRERLESIFVELAVMYRSAPTLYDLQYYEKEIDKVRELLDISLDVSDDMVGRFWQIVREIVPLAMIDSPRTQSRIEEALATGYDNVEELKKLLADVIAVEMRGE